MVFTGAVRHHYALAYDLRAVYAVHVAAMVIGHVCRFEVGIHGYIGDPAIALPVADTGARSRHPCKDRPVQEQRIRQ